ncbi:Endo-1,3-1,4-beta-glycanase ExsH [Pirellulimonas nuda]|uniref:Endo-1,3-1,4-beta-glycanase ExsH n=1 Tax=Pirellulimonas nuda TaxID=2528009 RepID=A0A518DHJ2_9BACT|nr:family 16 glycosylhydrolase [Pirellulimonas nuda]QDU90941.1 Endo-1,3-1,4-beta-glycanase ExsH [Pirellulimonas nuda]
MHSRNAATLLILLGGLSATSGHALAAPPAGYQLLFADEFNATTTLDSMKWLDRYPWGRTHNHDAYAAPENVVLGDGTLTLLAERLAQGGEPFTSGTISTGYSKFTFTEGYAEARILLPSTPGSWPAFWGLYTGWPPESDIMEFPIFTSGDTKTDYHVSWHYKAPNGSNASSGGFKDPSGVGDLTTAYHTFGMEWKKNDFVKYFFDGQLVHTFDNDAEIAEMQHMYLILNYAVGGWPGTPSTSQWPVGHTDETKIDWVRVWQKTDPNTLHEWTRASNGNWGDNGNWSGAAPSLGTQIARFGQVNAATVRVDWANLRTVGSLLLEGSTRYTIGTGDESLKFAGADQNALSQIFLTNGPGATDHVINSRIDLWSQLAIRNSAPAATLTINGDVVGYGAMSLNGPGLIRMNGRVYNNASITLNSGANAEVNGGLYRDSPPPADTRLAVGGGGTVATLTIANLNYASALGFLPNDPARFVLNAGRVRLTGSSTMTRGFTIDAGGATFETAANAVVNIADDPQNAGMEVVTNAAGTLTLDGAGIGVWGKELHGQGALTKAGAGSWNITSANYYAGTTAVAQGELVVSGSTGFGAATVAAGSRLSGAGLVRGDLASAGVVAPGAPSGQLTVGGAYQQHATGELEIVLSPASVDSLKVLGEANLAGALKVVTSGGYLPQQGASFELISAAGVTGEFQSVLLPALEGGFSWSLQYSTDSVVLRVLSALPGDYNQDGLVDAADYTVWRDQLESVGASLTADGDGDGSVGTSDYHLWKEHFGQSLASGSPAEAAAVPEPTGLCLIVAAGVGLGLRRRWSLRTGRHA